MGTVICECVTWVYTLFIISWLCTKAPNGEFKIEHYGWTSRIGLVLVDGGLDRVRTIWREKKEIKIVNKQAAMIESLIDSHCMKNVIS